MENVNETGLPKRRVRLTKEEKARKGRAVEVERYSLFLLEGDIKNVLRELKQIASRYQQDFTSVRIDINEEREQITILGIRPETDKEYSKRIEQLEQRKRATIEKQEIAEREMLRSLLKKYGKD